jgi:hypothetical protein
MISSNTNKAIFEWEGNNIKNYNELINNIEKKIENSTKKIKKNLIICLIELLQNGLNYSNDSNVKIIIEKHNKAFAIIIKNNAITPKINDLNIYFEYLKGKDLSMLKELYLNNLTKTISSDKKIGNGLILCMIKTNKQISLDINNNLITIKALFYE